MICLHSKFQHYQSCSEINDRFRFAKFKNIIYLSELSSMLNHTHTIKVAFVRMFIKIQRIKEKKMNCSQFHETQKILNSVLRSFTHAILFSLFYWFMSTGLLFSSLAFGLCVKTWRMIYFFQIIKNNWWIFENAFDTFVCSLAAWFGRDLI